MANWFVGLTVDAGDWFKPLVADAPSTVRVFHPEDLHATVAFLGRVGEEAARAAFELVEALDASAFTARLETLVPMGNPRRPSALSALISRGHDEAVAIIRALRDDMIAISGGQPETREPLPHITVARPTRNASGAERRAAVAWAVQKPAIGATLKIDTITLYTWSEDRQARQFRAVAKHSLP